MGDIGGLPYVPTRRSSDLIMQGGYQVNVIPSEAEVTLDIRALPDENIGAFYDQMRKLINDPAIELIPETRNQRPGAMRSEEHTSELQSHVNLVCRLLLEKK